MQFSLNTLGGKLIASTAVLGAAAGIAGLGTFGTFTATTTASQSVTAGTVKIDLGSPAAASTANGFNVAASGMVPGDVVQRTATLTNSGNQDLASLSLTTTASPSSLLDTDGTNGLQLGIQDCAKAWTQDPTSKTYTCSAPGGATQLLASGRVIQNTTLASALSLKSGQADNLLVTLTLPPTADNTFQGLSSTINFGFTGLQRAAKASS